METIRSMPWTWTLTLTSSRIDSFAHLGQETSNARRPASRAQAHSQQSTTTSTITSTSTSMPLGLELYRFPYGAKNLPRLYPDPAPKVLPQKEPHIALDVLRGQPKPRGGEVRVLVCQHFLEG